MTAPALVIGVGNPDRGDDTAGLAVAHAFLDLALPNVVIRASSGDGAALLSDWHGFSVVVLVDAMPSAGHPGSIRCFDALAQPLPADLFASSTHAFGVAQGVELARVLGLLPPMLIIYGIEGCDFAVGTPMSAEVVEAIPLVTAAIVAELTRWMGERVLKKAPF